MVTLMNKILILSLMIYCGKSTLPCPTGNFWNPLLKLTYEDEFRFALTCHNYEAAKIAIEKEIAQNPSHDEARLAYGSVVLRQMSLSDIDLALKLLSQKTTSKLHSFEDHTYDNQPRFKAQSSSSGLTLSDFILIVPESSQSNLDQMDKVITYLKPIEGKYSGYAAKVNTISLFMKLKKFTVDPTTSTIDLKQLSQLSLPEAVSLVQQATHISALIPGGGTASLPEESMKTIVSSIQNQPGANDQERIQNYIKSQLQ
jgi:hypothetical protein